MAQRSVQGMKHVTDAYLKITDVVKSYDGETNAVDHISIDIKKGEFVTFLGPSGSGKTTSLVMIAGFEEPTAGQILLEGQDLTRLKPWRRNIGMVFQNYALFPHMTVARNVEFPLKMRNWRQSDIRRRVSEVLDLVGLSAFAARHPRELSGGQQQRVALARGLAFNPDVLLLDEPLGALDKNLREQMQVEIKRIHREVGITMIYVTHDQTEAMTMSDRVAVFNHGKLDQVGAPLEVYHKPSTRFVGEFVGDSNFFTGQLHGSGMLMLDGLGMVRVQQTACDTVGQTKAFDVMVRPEKMRIFDKCNDPDMNVFDMNISAIVNYGDSLMVIGSSGKLPVRVRVTGNYSGLLLEEGSTVKVGWRPSEAHLIPRA
jgi:putative spermidine/putrescine transport system ATP-binding protein